MKADRIEFDI